MTTKDSPVATILGGAGLAWNVYTGMRPINLIDGRHLNRIHVLIVWDCMAASEAEHMRLRHDYEY